MNIEQAASNYLQKFERTDAYSPRHMEKAFVAGASWRGQQAASGFDEWKEKHILSIVGMNEDEAREKLVKQLTPEKCWQASALYSAKLLAEKDAEIEKAKELIKVMLAVLWSDDPKRWHRENAEKIKALLGEE